MRTYCDKCNYPQTTCVCKWVVPVSTPVEIVVLQHFRETNHAKNTVKLACLALPSIRVVSIKDEADINDLLDTFNAQEAALFFPSQTSSTISANSTIFAEKHYSTLLYIDGSWPQAKGIANDVNRNASMKNWQLPTGLKSRYKIRHTTKPGALSTLEAIAFSLELGYQIESAPLLTLQEKFQDHWRGPEQHQRAI